MQMAMQGHGYNAPQKFGWPVSEKGMVLKSKKSKFVHFLLYIYIIFH